VSAARRQPRPAGDAVRALTERLAPASTLGDVQRVWDGVVGPALAAVATPTAEARGTLTVTCTSAVWAQELDLMGTSLAERLNAALGGDRIHALRCQSVPAKSWSRAQT
jgi:predicted nucleic acid-binding Zn ribbon protein